MAESDVQTGEEAVKSRGPKLSAEKALPQSGADTLVRIIKGYAVASSGGQAKINYKDVASAAGISPFVVSGNNRFLLDSQILHSPKYGYYIPTESAVRFAREAAWDEPAAKAHLRTILLGTWYGQVVLQNFALRPVLNRSDLKRALAIKSGATEGDSTALDYLIDFVIYTGLVVEDERGMLKRGDVEEIAMAHDEAISPTSSENTVASDLRRIQRRLTRDLYKWSLHFHIRDLDELTPENAQRVRKWIESVTAGNENLDIDVEPETQIAADHQDLAKSA
jgi:hypothetical protein